MKEEETFKKSVEELRLLKKAFEEKILYLIEEFEKETSLIVRDVEINRNPWYMSGSYVVPACSNIKFDISL
jgi:hypothetical protein